MKTLADDELFINALEINSKEDRQHFVRAMAADADQEQRVLELIESHDALHTANGPQLFERGTEAFQKFAPLSPEEPAVSEYSGNQIGAYQLEELIGEGGMGLVFSARQTSPIRRRVALKLLKPGMDSRKVLQRFELEKQVLQQMKHPGITRILDAGLQPNGRPFFAMELIEDAASITEYADKKQLSIHQRIKLFQEVCDAVQHAHQRGVIHRDLKPTNILVTEIDGEACVKVIDFGIAKATRQEDSVDHLTTAIHECMGTLSYMSPEQAPWNDSLTDTRSDIYSLGIVLGELLVGSQRGHKPATAEGTTTLVAQLSALAETELAQVAENRSTTASGLRNCLQNELDWICAKACAVDAENRYAGVFELRADLDNFLIGGAVQAAKPSKLYHARKFITRNLLLTSVVTGAAFATLATAVVASYFAYQASQAEGKANDRLREVLAAQAELQEQTEKAEAERKTALAFIHHRAASKAAADASIEYHNSFMAAIRSGKVKSMTGFDPKQSLNFRFLTEPHVSLPIRGDFRWLQDNVLLDYSMDAAEGFSSNNIAELTALANTYSQLSDSEALADDVEPAEFNSNFLRLKFQKLMLREMCKQLPKSDPLIAEVLDNCGAICIEVGELEQAQKYLAESLRIWLASGRFPERVIQTRLFLAKSLSGQGKVSQAAAEKAMAENDLRQSALSPEAKSALNTLVQDTLVSSD